MVLANTCSARNLIIENSVCCDEDKSLPPVRWKGSNIIHLVGCFSCKMVQYWTASVGLCYWQVRCPVRVVASVGEEKPMLLTPAITAPLWEKRLTQGRLSCPSHCLCIGAHSRGGTNIHILCLFDKGHSQPLFTGSIPASQKQLRHAIDHSENLANAGRL